MASHCFLLPLFVFLFQFMEKADPDLELVVCSGHGKNGSLSVLQRTIRPQVVTTFELPGCTNMWTVLSETEQVGVFVCLFVSGYKCFFFLVHMYHQSP